MLPGQLPSRLTIGVDGPTAIVHDWFQGFHGSERTVDVMLSDVFPGGSRPDVYTFSAARELLPPRLAEAIVRESRLTRLPGIRQRGHDPGQWRLLLPYMPTYFNRLRLDKYDLVISSSHACAVNVRPREDAIHACYCYTPMRYAWMPETERGRAGGLHGLGLRALRGYLQRVDRTASRRPDGYAAISEAVRERIRRFYGRDAVVIHPPVDVDALEVADEKDDGYFLWVQRLVGYKRPELVVEAFRGTPHRLTMIGVGPLERRLRRNLPPNVELRGWVNRAELVGLYARARGFVHVGKEDFGITMVEALASGTPVIALDAGGARDIVRHGRDGILLPRPEVQELRKALDRLVRTRWDPHELRARAEAFSRPTFVGRIRAWLASLEEPS
jgi:glycosyltransferase involved in cell wall biosynthesis